MNEIRVRFAPSPTGYLHIGGLRTALYNYLFARKEKGTFILRIEDTDKSRQVPGAIENLINTLNALGLDYDEGPGRESKFAPYIQSERLSLYKEHAQYLLDSGFAYPCFCSPETLTKMREEQQSKGEFVKYDRRCLSLTKSEIEQKIAAGEKYVIRLKMPDNRKFQFNDLIRGEVEMDSNQSDDQVLLKSDGFPTYHLAAVVDDHLMQISHIIRGEEWLSSTPKHIYLYECLGWETPKWVHLPLILNADRTKLSKRMNDVSVDSYIAKGYLKEALINFVALLGWHPSDDRELFTLDELCNAFSLDRVNKAGAIFDLTKLDWMNGQYLHSLPVEDIAMRCKHLFLEKGYDLSDENKYQLAIAVARERCTLLNEIVDYCKMFYQPEELKNDDIKTLLAPEAQKVLAWFATNLPILSAWDTESIQNLVNSGIAELGIKGKKFYTPLRLALIHQQHGPELPSTFIILGKEESIKRLQQYLPS
ncbi:MAG TPA: glutamate--tRNA ligase [Candidatus Cloacimonas sp.]|nr:glutamate--tRNA ligase [Candidatus Cloacimonas sp.]